jgi:hypothetical protein
MQGTSGQVNTDDTKKLLPCFRANKATLLKADNCCANYYNASYYKIQLKRTFFIHRNALNFWFNDFS